MTQNNIPEEPQTTPNTDQTNEAPVTDTGFDYEPDEVGIDEERDTSRDYMFKEENPSGMSDSKDTRPSLSPSDKEGVAPILDITKDGIFNSPEMMARYFPRVQGILQNSTDATRLTVEEVNELSRYCLSKAIFTNDSMNPIQGLLDNQLHMPNGDIVGSRLNKPKLSESGDLDLADIASLGVTIKGGGIITYPLTNSGFRIKLKPFGTDAEIKLEESITNRIGEVGRSTIGGGILAMDAIIIDVVMDELLNNVVDHNIKDVDIDDKTTLRSLISHKDIRPLIGVMNAIMHLDGYSYDIPCEKCDTLSRMNLNIIRSMHFDHGKLNNAQLEQLQLPIKAEITTKNIRRYQEMFDGHERSKEFKIGKSEYRIHLKTGSIDSKMKSYGLLFNLLEKLARELVGINGTAEASVIDAKCQELLRRMWHIHYLPIIKSIEINTAGGWRRATKPEVILELLKSISTSDRTGGVAAYLTEFAYDNTVTFATHIPTCSGCGHVTDEIRNYDPVVDFFIRRMSHMISTSIVQEVMIRS